ncbi:hydroxymethylbilane synthase [Halovenus sp. WSH3]|uniref:Hydroxymethylbilane synthase n=1 Tax=Halovenus carboxidivorans TaxID=2692199 RepID=A0A6B0SY79_9EURY|nr:hydroxymethylbilane synthase [Halovenus carboxidivorans]MXR50137.1 hydroxymethylbilane synthase [Halovenus carboxidivorans]
MSTRGDTVRIATRGSALARRQAAMIEEQLTQRRLSVELVEVETTGDQIQDELIHRLGTTGAFVRSLDEKVLSGDLDAAVHSMKDMPTEQPDELIVAGTPERGPAGDVLVTPDGRALADLPEGATVGTSSLRRRAQLLAERPDLDVQPLRGNVDTRVQKLLAPSLQREHEARIEAEKPGEDEEAEQPDDDTEYERGSEEWFDDLSELERQALGREVETEYDAICLAEAGLARSDLLELVEYERLDPTTIVPAPAQGAIAVTALDGDLADQLHEILDHPHTRVETTVERSILAELGGGCVAPVGIRARLQGEYVNTTVRVLAQDGGDEVRASRDIPIQRHAEAAREFARDLADQGATELIEQARRDEPDEPKRS